MSKRIVTALAVLGTVSLIPGCNFDQPSAGCIVQDASVYAWQAKYILKESSSPACGTLKGDVLGVWKYSDPNATGNTATKLGIRARSAVGTVTYADSDGKNKTVNSVTLANSKAATNLSGTMAEEPDAQGLCRADGFNTTTISKLEIKKLDGTVALPARTLTYTYKEIDVYSKPSAPGTQLAGSLTYTDGACTAEYEVWALWPQTPCVPGSTDPIDNCGEGSGLNPDFKVVCDPDLKACVPAQRPPSFSVQQ